MELPVLVEKVGTNGYTARDPFGRSASGPTADAAVAALRTALTAAGGEVAMVSIPVENALMKWAGTWENDPHLDEFRRAVEQYRQDRDADPDSL
jgi:hypothetical protein